MKVLVIGAAGFVGDHIAKRLLERGDAIVGVDVVNDYYDPALKEARLAILDRAGGARTALGHSSAPTWPTPQSSMPALPRMPRAGRKRGWLRRRRHRHT